MKTRVLLIAFLTSTMIWGGTLTPIVPNADFENWTVTSYSYPENYLFNSNIFKAMLKEEFNVLQTTDCYHGQYAVKLVTDTTTRSVNFGFIIGSNGENGDPSTWKGGAPITEPITGIRGYYKYDFVQPDSAIILVTFRYQGTFLAEYEFFLKEKKSAYTLFEFDIIPKWDSAISPDSVIVGFASSGNVDNGSGQPGSVLYLDSISFDGVTTQPDELNGDFEHWTVHTTPVIKDWTISNTEREDDWRTTDAYEGNYAVKLTTMLENGENNQQNVRPRVLYLGSFDKLNGQWMNGIHVNNTKDSLSFWYKYLPGKPTGMASVMIMCFSNGQFISNNFETIPASETYQEIKIPLGSPYFTNDIPGELILMFQSSVEDDTTLADIGSTLYLDHITIIPNKSIVDPNVDPVNPEIKNGSFEIWDNNFYETPEFYPFSSNMFRTDRRFPYNVMKSDWAQHGSYALQLVSDGMTDMPNFGFVINENPTTENPETWTGGIPINEKPTGLQGYYLFHSIGPDSAMIMLYFLKEGVKIGHYNLFLQPAMGDWAAFNQTFTPALTETPDSMIMLIASGSSFDSNNPMESMLLLDNISLTGVTAQPDKLNGDFENWVTTSLDQAPSWYLSDGEQPRVHKTTNAAEGDFAMELQSFSHTDNENNFVTEPSWVSNGYWDKNTQDWAGGSPLYRLNDTIAFYYQYLPAVPDDSAQVSIMFKNQGQFVGFNDAILLPNTAYQYKEIPLLNQSYNPVNQSDSILFMFQSSIWEHKDGRFGGSILRIDDVHFKSSRAAVNLKAIKETPWAEIYPNPSQGVTKIRLSGSLPEKLDIFNMAGQRIQSITQDKISHEMLLDLTGQAPGLYLVRLAGSQKTVNLKLLVK